MFIAGNLLSALATILDIVLTAYTWIIIIRAIISWVNPDPWNPIVQFLYRATDPVLRPIQRMLPMKGWGIDFSPLVAILAIIFIQKFLVASLTELAWRLR
ncbi:MAG: YggT family protein [Candidatus Methylomirabilis oxyfera]|nr:YggT family protein [Candidatus Methylomirabilis oxyfera]